MVDGLESPDGGEDKNSEGARCDSRTRRVSLVFNGEVDAEIAEETARSKSVVIQRG